MASAASCSWVEHRGGDVLEMCWRKVGEMPWNVKGSKLFSRFWGFSGKELGGDQSGSDQWTCLENKMKIDEGWKSKTILRFEVGEAKTE